MATPMRTMVVRKVEGLAVEILRNHLLSEKDSDEACFFTLSDIVCFPVSVVCLATSLT